MLVDLCLQGGGGRGHVNPQYVDWGVPLRGQGEMSQVSCKLGRNWVFNELVLVPGMCKDEDPSRTRFCRVGSSSCRGGGGVAAMV